MNRDQEITFEASPLYGQIEIGDRDTTDIPQWSSGEEPVISSGSMVCVATQPDTAGDVRVTIRSGEDNSVNGSEVFSGEINLPSGILAVGNSIAAQSEELELSPARRLQLRVFVSPIAAPNQITVLLP
ncbi:hypothetical protein [Cryobacterium psychrophilum]|uniref:Uncharacterized protein n=1 Tax=Cryobacterium psychrophilum TaxID=41988 RepID=A0A4Y8KPY1_9MICO|nr:hypothetical protein [Cryobacterium psychrophilum]TFD80840.1 hypothetical protein E3T53_04240 [Cryobacterium psychrophilum]